VKIALLRTLFRLKRSPYLSCFGFITFVGSLITIPIFDQVNIYVYAWPTSLMKEYMNPNDPKQQAPTQPAQPPQQIAPQVPLQQQTQASYQQTPQQPAMQPQPLQPVDGQAVAIPPEVAKSISSVAILTIILGVINLLAGIGVLIFAGFQIAIVLALFFGIASFIFGILIQKNKNNIAKTMMNYKILSAVVVVTVLAQLLSGGGAAILILFVALLMTQSVQKMFLAGLVTTKVIFTAKAK
jgi:hypothetical protein